MLNLGSVKSCALWIDPRVGTSFPVVMVDVRCSLSLDCWGVRGDSVEQVDDCSGVLIVASVFLFAEMSAELANLCVLHCVQYVDWDAHSPHAPCAPLEQLCLMLVVHHCNYHLHQSRVHLCLCCHLRHPDDEASHQNARHRG